ncbi:MAG: hypothetical protein KME06_09525 [Kastovskya adunca ATA6-11-RM4]|nr:hypothetical protein [Kastovskya adunca ATA6-11-RM4]
MVEHQEIDTRLIRRDGGTQTRAKLHEETLQEYKRAWENGITLPPIDLFFDGLNYWLGDGYHRLTSKEQREEKTIAANIYQGTQRDAVRHSLQANSRHGLPRSAADKRRAVIRALKDEEWSQWSNVEIGRLCNVDEKLVRNIKIELMKLTSDKPKEEIAQKNGVEIEDLQIAKERVENAPQKRKATRNGKTVQMNTTNIGESSKSKADEKEQEMPAAWLETGDFEVQVDSQVPLTVGVSFTPDLKGIAHHFSFTGVISETGYRSEYVNTKNSQILNLYDTPQKFAEASVCQWYEELAKTLSKRFRPGTEVEVVYGDQVRGPFLDYIHRKGVVEKFKGNSPHDQACVLLYGKRNLREKKVFIPYVFLKAVELESQPKFKEGQIVWYPLNGQCFEIKEVRSVKKHGLTHWQYKIDFFSDKDYWMEEYWAKAIESGDYLVDKHGSIAIVAEVQEQGIRLDWTGEGSCPSPASGENWHDWQKDRATILTYKLYSDGQKPSTAVKKDITQVTTASEMDAYIDLVGWLEMAKEFAESNTEERCRIRKFYPGIYQVIEPHVGAVLVEIIRREDDNSLAALANYQKQVSQDGKVTPLATLIECSSPEELAEYLEAIGVEVAFEEIRELREERDRLDKEVNELHAKNGDLDLKLTNLRFELEELQQEVESYVAE